MQQATDTIRLVLEQSRVLSPKQISDFVAFIETQPLRVREVIAQALTSDAEKFISYFDSEIARLRRIARSNNFLLFKKCLDSFVNKVTKANQEIDDKISMENIRTHIQDM